MINFSLGVWRHQIVSMTFAFYRTGIYILSGNVILALMFSATPQFDLQQTTAPYRDMLEAARGYGS